MLIQYLERYAVTAFTNGSKEDRMASEGAAGAYCESAKTEKSSKTDELRPKMIMAGMTAGMVNVS